MVVKIPLKKEQKDGKVDRSQEIVIYSNSTDEKRGEG